MSDSSPPTLETEDLVRVWMVVAYDGGAFNGFAYQRPEVPTVARELRRALGSLIGYEPQLTVAGRTDAGVHAWGQFVHVDIPQRTIDRYGFERMQLSLNKQMRPEVVVRELSVAPGGFHARFTPIARRYRYTIYNSPVPNPFLIQAAWHVPKPLSIDAMNTACEAIIGEHDFASFCKERPGPRNPESEDAVRAAAAHGGDHKGLDKGHRIRRIHTAKWLQLPDEILRFDVQAKAFCHQMVRSLVGTMVAIGLGKQPPGYMLERLEERTRHGVITPAPPKGLCLWEVVLPDTSHPLD